MVITFIDNISNCCTTNSILPNTVLGNISLKPTPACIVVLNKT